MVTVAASCLRVARDTSPVPVPYVEVHPFKWMTIAAMGLDCVDCSCTYAPQDVDLLSNGFQMVGANTEPDSTQMIDLQPIWDWPDQQHVRVPVGIGQDSVNDKPPVPPGVGSPLPHPMSLGFPDPGPEPGLSVGTLVDPYRHGSDGTRMTPW